ncbi:MAG: ABC transporter ATP-binding protein [Promethearchaeota archaeon]|nr:MAG: ABC transporter ATP-binding protein [Candidatus Lokiarchaeota archaeon]
MSDKLPLIYINDVNYSYPNGTKALNSINLKIYKGELIGIMGKNGAGKTTLIRTFNGLIRPTNGSIFINGENIEPITVGALSQKVGIIFQNPQHQVFSNTVEEEIIFSIKSLKLSKKEIQEKTNEILLKFDLEKYRDRSPLNLSGGETKKLAVASILCRDPDIFVFDEPTLGQDAKEIDFFIKLIEQEMNKGKTIIIITHNIEFAMEYLPRTILMADGKIIADGPTHTVLKNEFLVEQTALILPQIIQLKKELSQIGINFPAEIDSKNDMMQFLSTYMLDNYNISSESK